MAFAIWHRALSATIWPKRNRGNGLFLDEKSLRFELARERMRVDRNQSPLAVLTIELPASRATPADFDFLARVLIRRLRITDTIGFLAERQVGVLLPDTSETGAWKVASDICSVYPVGHDRPDCEVYVYPEDPTSRRDHTPENDQETVEEVEENVETSIESLLTQPSPRWQRTSDVFGAMVGLVLSLPVLAV